MSLVPSNLRAYAVMGVRTRMLLEIIIFLASIACGFGQFYPGGGMQYGNGQAMAQSPRGMGDFYPLGGYPYMMPPQVPRYMPNFYPTSGHFPNAMGYGVSSAAAEPSASFPSPLLSASDNANENANTNVNINSGSYRRSLHSPSKEHGTNRNANTNTNVNMAS